MLMPVAGLGCPSEQDEVPVTLYRGRMGLRRGRQKVGVKKSVFHHLCPAEASQWTDDHAFVLTSTSYNASVVESPSS